MPLIALRSFEGASVGAISASIDAVIASRNVSSDPGGALHAVSRQVHCPSMGPRRIARVLARVGMNSGKREHG